MGITLLWDDSKISEARKQQRSFLQSDLISLETRWKGETQTVHSSNQVVGGLLIIQDSCQFGFFQVTCSNTGTKQLFFKDKNGLIFLKGQHHFLFEASARSVRQIPHWTVCYTTAVLLRDSNKWRNESGFEVHIKDPNYNLKSKTI